MIASETNQLPKQCANCQKTDAELLRCTRCKNIYYCGIDCQKSHWPHHKLQCSKSKEDSKIQPPPKKEEDKQDGLSEFKDLKHLGSGNFSQIFKGTSKKDGKIYAIKQVEKAKLSKVRKEADLFMEKHCLSKMKECPYVIRLHKTFQDEISLFIQMQCPEGGEIWNVAKHYGIISQSLFKYYAGQIIRAVLDVHSKYDIVHRDLKPENILLTADHQVKLIDFGTAKDLSRPDIKGSGNGLKGRKPFEHYVGTPNYMAPECIHNTSSQKIADAYSLAGVLYFLKVGSPPFYGGSQYIIFKKSLETEMFLCDELFSNTLKDLILKMNKKRIEERLGLDKAAQHQYFQGVDFQTSEGFSYEKALLECNQFQKMIWKHCQYLSEKYEALYKVDPDKRRSIFKEQIVAYLETVFEDNKDNFDQKLLRGRIEVMKIQTELMVNLRQNHNDGFTEIYKEYNNIVDKVAEPFDHLGGKQKTEEVQEKEQEEGEQIKGGSLGKIKEPCSVN